MANGYVLGAEFDRELVDSKTREKRKLLRGRVKTVQVTPVGTEEPLAVHLRVLTLAERDAYFDVLKSDENNGRKNAVALLSKAVSDPDGSACLTEMEVEELPADVADELVKEALAFSLGRVGLRVEGKRGGGEVGETGLGKLEGWLGGKGANEEAVKGGGGR